MQLKRWKMVCLWILTGFCFACQKEGCMDSNAVNYDRKATFNDGFCVYRYLTAVSIKKVTFTKDSNHTWDAQNADILTFPNEEYPDLKFYLKRNQSNSWEVETATLFDRTAVPLVWEIEGIGNIHLQVRETYTFQLVDEDEKGNEILFEGTFIPQQALDENTIMLENTDQSIIIELTYIVS